MARHNINHRLGMLLCLAAILTKLLFTSAATAQPYRPELRIAKSNGNVTLSWPKSAYYYTLMENPDLSSPGAWNSLAAASADFPGPFPFLQNVQQASNFAGDQITFTLPAANAQSFYGLDGPRLIPIFQFAVFYEGLLEFSTTASITVNGPVHANGDIYTGTSAFPCTFNRTVTTAGAISSPAWNGQSPPWTVTGDFNGSPPSVTNVARLEVLAGTNLHGMIEMPPIGESPASDAGKARLCNWSQVVVLVSNTSVTVRIQSASPGNNPGSDPSPIIIRSTNTPTVLATNFPWLTTTNVFTDQRESKTVKTTQIDLGSYKTWANTNPPVLAKFPPGSGLYPTILFVADNRTNTSSSICAIRITNGIALPYNGSSGFTLVTPNPLYVWGNYNCTNASHLGTTNTSSSVPAALMCDALTMLSPTWKDSASAGPLSGRTASSSDTVNAAIITGNVPSTGSSSSQFSGGLHNLNRLLENWSSSTLWFNTSRACLYRSTIATNQFINPGVYYNPPTRRYNFDPNFTDLAKLPPGCPIVGVPAP